MPEVKVSEPTRKKGQLQQQQRSGTAAAAGTCRASFQPAGRGKQAAAAHEEEAIGADAPLSATVVIGVSGHAHYAQRHTQGDDEAAARHAPALM
ncbi:hypothetical protein MTO96_044505 [Rhipicephalus appendiculatus]